jgi:hypothetical protein
MGTPTTSRLVCALVALFVAVAPSSLGAQSGTEHPTATNRVMAELRRIQTNVRSSVYTHSTRIDERIGRYEFDCSAMAAFVLRRAAPQALASIHSSRPLAVEFYRTIAAASATRARNGWLHIPRIEDARAGDVLAWPRPRWFPSHNTGHVVFVVETPVVTPRGVLVRIADSTRVGHENDTRDYNSRQSGFGYGTLLITTDPATGAGTGYGWAGRYTPDEWIVPTPVVIGRPTR